MKSKYLVDPRQPNILTADDLKKKTNGNQDNHLGELHKKCQNQGGRKQIKYGLDQRLQKGSAQDPDLITNLFLEKATDL